MSNKYGAHMFTPIFKQACVIGQHETMLATFAGDDFVNLLSPVLKFLSENTTRTYVSYLIEAKEMILQGKKEMETYDYFISKLLHLQEDKQ